VQGSEERPVQDHQLLRQESTRPDGPVCDQGKAQGPRRPEGFQSRGLLLRQGQLQPRQAGVPARRTEMKKGSSAALFKLVSKRQIASQHLLWRFDLRVMPDTFQ